MVGQGRWQCGLWRWSLYWWADGSTVSGGAAPAVQGRGDAPSWNSPQGGAL